MHTIQLKKHKKKHQNTQDTSKKYPKTPQKRRKSPQNRPKIAPKVTKPAFLRPLSQKIENFQRISHAGVSIFAYCGHNAAKKNAKKSGKTVVFAPKTSFFGPKSVIKSRKMLSACFFWLENVPFFIKKEARLA
jgi:hypothetical protein